MAVESLVFAPFFLVSSNFRPAACALRVQDLRLHMAVGPARLLRAALCARR